MKHWKIYLWTFTRNKKAQSKNSQRYTKYEMVNTNISETRVL